MLLVGVLDKVGTFGMIRLCLPLFPEAAKWFTPAIIVFAIISIIYGALLAIGQTDLMRLIAYTSVSHFGFIVLGIFAMTTAAQNGATLLHGQPRVLDRGHVPRRRRCSSGAAARAGSPTSAAGSGSRRCWPGRSWWPACPAWRCRGCPASSASSWCWWARSTGTRSRPRSPSPGIVLAALYILLAYQRMMTGPEPEGAFVDHTPDMQRA